MTPFLLHQRLDAIARRQVLATGLKGLGWAWCALALVVWGIVEGLRPSGSGWALFLLSLPAAAVGLGFVAVAAAKRQRPTRTMLARWIEEAAPNVDARLITAIEQVPDAATGRFTVLQQQVIEEAAAHMHRDWPQQLVPGWKLAWPTGLIVCDVLLMLGVLIAASFGPESRFQAPVNPLTGRPVSEDLPVTVEPGDIDVERGASLLVIARFRDELPDRVTLQLQPVGGEWESIRMDKALDDPLFGARLTNVKEELLYRVVFDDHSTREYRVKVFDLPALVRGDLILQTPEYTGQPVQRFENAFETTVVERTEVTIECRVNKPLAKAELVDPQNQATAMSADPQNPLLWRYSFTPEKSTRLKLALVDDCGRVNRDPEQFRVDVVPNQPPKLELAFPGKDVRVSPLEELTIEGRVTDDFGLDEFGLVLSVAGREPKTVPLGKDARNNKPQSLKLTEALEALQVAPDDLVSYHLYAVDRDAEGQPRTVTGDLYFAEVRPFEETFRQMEAPPGAGAQGAQSPAGNQIDNMLKVQKQILSATWNVIRKPAKEWNDQTAAEVAVILESQAANKTKLLELMVDLQGAALQRSASQAVELMTAVAAQLQQSIDEQSRETLNAAVVPEQGAYQALLKLKAREHNVMQAQQSGGGGGGGASPSEQQLEQLELSQKQNRYESRNAANQERTSAQQEELGTLDRLKELARRQGDLNQKLRELDAALRLAQSQAEKDEIERQLKRLRDEQQQLLQDADELRNRLAQSQRQEEFRETREQLEDTRRRMVDAAEALQEGQLSQALSSTTRAERELKNLQQEFRQQTSARFAETMRELRESARGVAERERQLAEELAGKNGQSEKPSLRQDRTKQDLQGDFEEQKAAVQELLNRAREVVKEAETAEPLLAQQLYDTLRHTRDDQLEPALEALPQLVQRGFVPEAQKVEEQVRKGLDRLQTGIDDATESVLGSEVESLKRAKAELAELSLQLQAELAQQTARSGSASSKQPGAAPGEEPSGNSQPGGNGGQPGDEKSPEGQPGTPGEGNEPGKEPGAGDSNQPNSKPGQGAQPGKGTAQGTGDGQDGPGQEPGQGQPGRQGKGQGSGRNGEGAGASPLPGEGTGQGTQPGRGQGQGGGQGQEGQPGDDTPSPGGGQPGRRPGGLRNSPPGPQSPSGQPSPGNPLGGMDQGGFGGPGGQGGPISGDGYREWSERLRDVETMVNDPDLQAEVSKLRDQARSLRAESNRHSRAPNWDLVKSSLYEPMVELQRRLAEEVARQESDDALVPIDRDPVPARYKELVRSYYERLGRGAE
ncbi:MAG: DUF4175 family protein [Planctomycetaceae bacterium]|nr:DUF4175 family protein [Planctomycetaceae bacterium]